ncbi:unnamed protein product [Closterium sp. NIES-54]
MSSEPFTVFVADDLALADVEHWLLFDEAVLPHPSPSTDDPHSLTQLLPDLPFIPSDPSLAFLTDDHAPVVDAYRGDADTDYVPARDAPTNQVEVCPELRLDDLFGGLTERWTLPASDGGIPARQMDSRKACTDGSGEAGPIISSFADFVETRDSIGVNHSHGSATPEDGLVERVELLQAGTWYAADAGNVLADSNLAASNLGTCLPEQADSSTWRPDPPRDAEGEAQQAFQAASASVQSALQPDGSDPQVLTFDEASERLFAATAPATFQNARGRWEQVQREQALRAQLLLPEQEEAQNQPLTPQQQTQQQSQQRTQQHSQQQQSQQQSQQPGRDHDLGKEQQKQGTLQFSISASARPLPFAIHARPSPPQRSSSTQRPSPSRGGDMGVSGLRGPSADPPSAPPPCKLPRRPPDLSSRLAAVLQNINPPRPAPSPWQPVPCLPKPGLPSAATPAAAAAAAAIPPATAAAAPAAASAVAAAAAVAVAVACAVSCLKAPESRLVVGGSRGDASGFMGSTLPSSAVRTSYAAANGYNQRVPWLAAFSDKTAIRKIRVCAAHSDPLSTDPDGEEISASASSRAFVAAPNIPEFGPERPLRVDLSGMLPRPMSGAKEGMLKQQLMALAEAMAVDDSVRGARGGWHGLCHVGGGLNNR